MLMQPMFYSGFSVFTRFFTWGAPGPLLLKNRDKSNYVNEDHTEWITSKNHFPKWSEVSTQYMNLHVWKMLGDSRWQSHTITAHSEQDFNRFFLVKKQFFM